jgi:hypothetical protein
MAERPQVSRVITVKPDRPYFDAWLRRMQRQFAASGRLSQTAVLLAGEYGESADMWAKRLRNKKLHVNKKLHGIYKKTCLTRFADWVVCRA